MDLIEKVEAMEDAPPCLSGEPMLQRTFFIKRRFEECANRCFWWKRRYNRFDHGHSSPTASYRLQWRAKKLGNSFVKQPWPRSDMDPQAHPKGHPLFKPPNRPVSRREIPSW